ncbi:tumor protein p53-inducible nuclear protein 2 [Hydra vulgaris]|uniref:Tumor protein p53-inducible nuclear protein 2 n=1 Tax=Hydra vulgaris TaxID=6087 RepID=A0ABM4DNK5_HYDVU
MLSAISSYIWGSSEQAEEKTSDVKPPCEGLETLENDWVFIKPKDFADNTVKRAHFNEDGLSTASESSVEESWLVTPPQCFNAKMEIDKTSNMSPMENLLIEHPSMSIYHVSNKEDKEMKDVKEISVGRQNCDHRAVAGRLQLLESRTPLKDLSEKILNKKRNKVNNNKQKNMVYIRSRSTRANKQYGRMNGKHTGMVGKRAS